MNSAKILPTIVFLFVMLFINACKKDDDPTGNNGDQTIEESFNANCGIIPPVVACIKGAKVFIPNAFSPNTDGFNDVLFPHAGEGMEEIISFKIYDESGSLIFQESNIPLFSAIGAQYGWDGKHPDGSIQDGIYTYTISLSNILGEVSELKGAICCRATLPVVCVENEAHLAWGTQHDGNGGLNISLPSYEDCE